MALTRPPGVWRTVSGVLVKSTEEMMRELLFRAWNDRINRMLDGDLIESEPMISTGLSYGKLYVAETYHGDWRELPVMQWTGLRDKNGRELFEGDIVKAASAGQHAVCIVKWGRGPAGFFLYRKTGGIVWHLSGGGFNYNEESVEIIGNRFENPELLPDLDESI